MLVGMQGVLRIEHGRGMRVRMEHGRGMRVKLSQ